MKKEAYEKRYIRDNILCFSAINLVNIFLYYFILDNILIAAAFIGSLILTILVYYFILKNKIEFKYIINYGIIILTFFIYSSVIIFLNSNRLVFIWFLLVPISVAFHYKFKVTIIVTLLILLLASTTPFISSYINIEEFISFSDRGKIYIDYSIIILSIGYLLMLLYHNNQFNKLKIETSNIKSVEAHVTKLAGQAKEEEEKAEKANKFNDLYEEIEKYFDERKTYKNNNFNMTQLTFDLNTNATYISNALNQKSNLNFKSYLNKRRIADIKKRIDNRDDKKFTLKHLYMSVGYKNQSTFNKAFKEVLGITPREYIKKLD